MAMVIPEDTRSAAERLLKHFSEVDRKTLARMLGGYDQWRESETFYDNVIVQVEVGCTKPQRKSQWPRLPRFDENWQQRN